MTIEGITRPIVLDYFHTLNAADFEATAALFADDGMLIAPFEEGVRGREAIASYLKAEAVGLQAFPRQGLEEVIEGDIVRVIVSGKVQTPLFGVNVAWTFLITPEEELAMVEVKLLASPGELLNLRQFR